MYVLVHHNVTDPARFWASAADAIPNVPEHLKLHQTLAGRDGRKATCVWEAESVEAVRSYLEPVLGDVSKNDYSEAENREGIALPTRIEQEVTA